MAETALVSLPVTEVCPMNGYETVYVPEMGRAKQHACRPQETLDFGWQIESPRGTIICCDACGQHWFSHFWGQWKKDELYTVKWHKVRWFHFKKRRKILGIE